MSPSVSERKAEKPVVIPPEKLKKTLFVAREDFSATLGTQFLSFTRGQLIDASLAKRLVDLSCPEVEEFDIEALIQCPHCGRIFPQDRG